MNILLVSHQLDFSGAPLALLELGKSLIRLGYSVSMSSLQNGPLRNDFFDSGIKIFNLEKNTSDDFDLIIANTIISVPPCLDFCKSNNKIVAWIHESEYFFKIIGISPKSFRLKELKFAVFPSRFQINEFSKWMPMASKSQLKNGVQIPIGIFPAKSQKSYLVCSGHWEERKSQITLVNLLKNIKDFPDIYFVGASRPSIELSNKFVFTGALSPFDAKVKIAESRGVISCAISETQNLVAIEAMMLGIPVMLSDIPAHRELKELIPDILLFDTSCVQSFKYSFDLLLVQWNDMALRMRLKEDAVRIFGVDEFDLRVSNLITNIKFNLEKRIKIKLVVATRMSEAEFFKKTATGRSLALNTPSTVELRLFPNNTEGLPTLYNRAIKESINDPAVLIFAHDDLHLVDFFWVDRIKEGLSVFDIVGVAGNRRRVLGQPSWAFVDAKFTWDKAENLSGTVGHGSGFPPGNLSIFGPSKQKVLLLDGLLLAAHSQTLIDNAIFFDERFKFHFYDLDFCRQAETKHISCGTWDISLVHESGGSFGTNDWRNAYQTYLEKWDEAASEQSETQCEIDKGSEASGVKTPVPDVATQRKQSALVASKLKAGIALHAAGKLDKAIPMFDSILLIAPHHVEATYRRGLIYHQQGLDKEAVVLLEKVLPQMGEGDQFCFNYGTILLALKFYEHAAVQFRKSLNIKPNNPDALGNLGIALQNNNEFEAAGGSYIESIRLRPNHTQTIYNLAALYHRCGLTEDAQACFHRVIQLQPNHPIAYNDALLMGQYSANNTPDEVFARAQEYAAQFEPSLKKKWRPHRNARDPEKRLKVGYVSADFREHAVSFFLEPIFENLDHANFEIFCYYNHLTQDAFTDRLQACADHWFVCHDMKDDALAEKIRADGIDILIDLSGHTGGNRLLTFARKPAPVQITFIGNPATTGLTSMDYRITDAAQDPFGMTERYHSEKLIRLPSLLVFKPFLDSPAVNELPALTNEFFIFACLNTLVKINTKVVRVWSAILAKMPNAKLMLSKAGDQGAKNRLIKMFEAEGISADRLLLMPQMLLKEYLALHHLIDMALDCFPWNGYTTTNHSVWMGVPVVSLLGHTALSRSAGAVMTSLGLEQFVTHSEEEYIQRALELAADLPELNRIRQSLRARFVERKLEQPLEVTRYFEAALRVTWRDWCKTAV